MYEAKRTDDKQIAFKASSATAGTMVIAIILSLFDRLEVPLPESIVSSLDGFNITLALVGIVVYSAMRKFRTIELDIGVLINWADVQRKKMIPVFDVNSNAWVLPDENQQHNPMDFSWGPIGRMSLIGPMMLFTIAITSVGMNDLAANVIWTVLMLIPIGIIVSEVMRRTKMHHQKEE